MGSSFRHWRRIQRLVTRFCSRRDGLRPDGNLQRRPSTGFETFCMEANEHFSPGSTYYYGISRAAIHGGISGGSRSHFQGNGVALPAIRYRQPSELQLHPGPDGDPAPALQATIWWLEGEGADPSNILALSRINSGTPWRPWRTITAYYGVSVLNLWRTAIILCRPKTS